MTDLLSLPGKARPYVMAHRGNRAVCPENTLASFRQAFADGCDILETDLHLSAEDEFICIHDATVDRTTDGSGPVAQKSVRELESLSAGKGFPQFAGETIPTLGELLEILPPGVALALELKTDRFLEPETGRRLAKTLRDAGVFERSVILSFSMERLKAVQQVAPTLPAGLISLTNPWPPRGYQLCGPFWPLTFVNPFYTLIAHARRQLTCPLDPTPDGRLWWYTLLRFDAILTDNPAKTIPLLARYRRVIR
jgi:glycerophosphoryl diester phosphodiesterase